VMWKKKWQAKGFGFTLKAENDFKLDEFYAGSAETFDPYYGINEDGNVFDPENIESLTNYVLQQTESGVFFMMADGGFSVEGRENVQEILSKQLYLCQCLVALSIVRENGHFVVKLFDIFTRFSVGLIYLMFKCFKQICICKPNTSRPANSERYLVCKWKKPNTDTIKRHLFDINQKLWANSHSSEGNDDVLELVPTEILQDDENFYKYIYQSNNEIGRNQIIGLLKIAAFSKDTTLLEKRQDDVRKQCLNLWKLPERIRRNPQKKSLDQAWSEMLLEWMKEKDFMKAPDIILQGTAKLDNCFPSIFGWYFVALDTIEDESTKKIRTFFMGRGGKDVQVYNQKTGSWSQSFHRIELPQDTLIYAEIVRELQGEGKSQTSIYALHIIDAISLGGIDIRKKSLSERNRMCQKFARALNKPYRPSTETFSNASHFETGSATIPIRCKRLFELSDVDRFFDRLNSYQLKDNKTRLGFTLKNDLEPDRFYIPHGLLFLNEVRSDYLKQFSKSQRRHYYFEKRTNKSFFLEQQQEPTHVVASFKNSFITRLLWGWEMEDQIYSNEDCDANDIEKIDRLLYRQDLNLFIYQKFNS
jgi:cap1 methyltransferase